MCNWHIIGCTSTESFKRCVRWQFHYALSSKSVCPRITVMLVEWVACVNTMKQKLTFPTIIIFQQCTLYMICIVHNNIILVTLLAKPLYRWINIHLIHKSFPTVMEMIWKVNRYILLCIKFNEYYNNMMLHVYNMGLVKL